MISHRFNKQGELFLIESLGTLKGIGRFYLIYTLIIAPLIVIGARSKIPIPVSIILCSFIFLFTTITLLYSIHKLRRTVTELRLSEGILHVTLYRLTSNSKELNFKLSNNQIQLKEYNFNNYGKGVKKGWILFINEKPRFNLISDFYNPELLNTLKEIEKGNAIGISEKD